MTQDIQESNVLIDDESRRSFMKKGALASGALALGLGASGTAAAQAQSALVFTYDYSPRRSFEQVSRIQQATTNSILTDIVNQPDEWTGFIGRYRRGDQDPGEFFLAFTRGGGLGSSEFSTNATFFSADANLLRVDYVGDSE